MPEQVSGPIAAHDLVLIRSEEGEMLWQCVICDEVFAAELDEKGLIRDDLGVRGWYRCAKRCE